MSKRLKLDIVVVEKDYSLCGRTIGCGEGLLVVEKDHCGGGKWKIWKIENIGKWKIWKKVIFGVGVGVVFFFLGKMTYFEKSRSILLQACRRRFFFFEK